MCGICGIVHPDANFLIAESTLLAMRDTMTYRGPDDAGQYLAPGIALGSRRLAILDLSTQARMPMRTSDRRYWITYNGEVYNYREFRPLLESRGYTFHSTGDTEVLLNLYASEGAAMLDRLNGMFAFAIWDSRERTLFIARDRLGIKPLYYAWHRDAFYFASEEKALFAAGVPLQFDSDTLEELLCFRYVAGEQTPFVGVKRLLPGHCLVWRDGTIQIRRWWNLAERAREHREALPADPIRWYRETLDDAINLRRISDVPVGVLLSGGLDSSSVAASLALQSGSSVASFTVRFSQTGYDESPLARQVAQRWNLDYHDLEITSDDLIEWLEQAIWLNDEPLVHGNDLHLLAISRYAKSRVTVLLSGEGADETLGGYVRYQPLRFPWLLNTARRFLPTLSRTFSLNGRVAKLSRFLSLDSLKQFVLLNACDVLPQDIVRLGMNPTVRFTYREQILAEAESLYPHDWMRQAMYSDQHTFLCSILDRNDRMTMGVSIECRVPFLDYRLVETLAALPSSVLLSGTQTKRLLRESARDRLPGSVLRHRKWGFGVPWRDYFRQNETLRERIRCLPDEEPISTCPFDRSRITNLVETFLSGENDYTPLVTQLFMISMWYQGCVKRAYASV
jgi:asparagine synthase (glutamine-hydrolysing)